MLINCEQCGKQGTLEGLSAYSGKKIRLKCPYCSGDFVMRVSGNGEGAAAPNLLPVPPIAVQSEDLPAISTDLSAEGAQETEALILEAKRIARLIISEIKLYNHDKIEKAASKREILELLRTDLVRGKQHYNSRIAAKLQIGPDYFMETVREILLAGKS